MIQQAGYMTPSRMPAAIKMRMTVITPSEISMMGTRRSKKTESDGIRFAPLGTLRRSFRSSVNTASSVLIESEDAFG